MREAAGRALRGAIAVFAGNAVEVVTGYLFWLVVSRASGPALVGAASSVIGLATLLASLSLLGVNKVVAREAGACASKGGGRECLYPTLVSSITLASAASAVAASTLLAAAMLGGFSNYTPDMLRLAAVLLLVWGLSLIPRSAAIGLYAFRLDFALTIIGNGAKLALALPAAKLGAWAVALSFSAPALARVVVLYPWLLAVRGPHTHRVAEVLRAGLSVWIPEALSTVGVWLGVIVVFSYWGAHETGLYYIAQAVMQGLLAAAAAINSVLLPLMAGRPGESIFTAERASRISLAVLAPASAALAAYPEPVLSLFGRDYVGAAPILAVMAASVPAANIAFTVLNSYFVRRLYGLTTRLGLAINAPRIAAYFALTPVYGGLGAAASILLGNMVGALYAYMLALREGVSLRGPVAVILGAFALAGSLRVLGVPWLLGYATAAAYPLALVRFGLVGVGEVEALASGLPEPLRSLVVRVVRRIAEG